VSDSDIALIGRESCGCITYANAKPNELDAFDRKAIQRILDTGGELVRMPVVTARQDPNFLPAECPHTPIGWSAEDA
jgi:hypothetical protein